MTNSSITILDTIKGLEFLSPIKLVVNETVLYDDFLGDETKPLIDAIKERFVDFDKYVVELVKIEVVHFHHSVIELQCRIDSETKSK